MSIHLCHESKNIIGAQQMQHDLPDPKSQSEYWPCESKKAYCENHHVMALRVVGIFCEYRYHSGSQSAILESLLMEGHVLDVGLECEDAT